VLLEWLHYQLVRGLHAPDTPLVATRYGKPMSTSQVERTVKIVAYRAGLRPWPVPMGQDNFSQISPHTLRRTFGSALLNQGVRIEVVSALLGHADTRITQKAYAELLQATVAREVRERW
jgi:integrase